MLENYKCGSYVFHSKFDSGNLESVEQIPLPADDHPGIAEEFNVRTKPDCGGTEYENQNRSWFFFSIHGGMPQRTCKINVMNMNKQGKLYTQGMQTVLRIGESPNKWERVKEAATHYTVGEQFCMSFLHKPHANTITRHYYAFTYPFTYTECMEQLNRFDSAYQKNPFKVNYIIQRLLAPPRQKGPEVDGNNQTHNFGSTNFVGRLNKMTRSELETEIYYHRELLIDSVEHRRVDLLTISSFHNIQLEREQRLPNLFPDKKTVRCNTFKNKKVIFLSSRVHPGETPASFVLNGFFKMIFDQQSLVAAVLRRMYVFKVVPFLNPDGVYNGHYRTDTFGTNLNRLYLNPSLETEPTIYAVRKLIRYYHFGMDLPEEMIAIPQTRCDKSTTRTRREQVCPTVVHRRHTARPAPKNRDDQPSLPSTESSTNQSSDSETVDTKSLASTNTTTLTTRNTSSQSSHFSSSATDSEVDLPNKLIICEHAEENEPVARHVSRVFHNQLVPEIKPVVVMGEATKVGRPQSYSATMRSVTQTTMSPCATPRHSFLLSARNRQLSSADSTNSPLRTQPTGNRITKRRNTGTSYAAKARQSAIESIPEIDSGNLFLYIDLHGHASKKGIFMYGNHLPTTVEAVECMLLPRLMSMNCQHFHFDSCVYSEKNMYHTGKRDGLSKEGSGRVSIYKATGLVKCYTLEGNYNTGKYVNVLPPRGNDPAPRKANMAVPKYTPAIFEDVGRALGPSILDLTGSNPLSRVQNSEFKTVNGIRKALRVRIEMDRNMPKTMFCGAASTCKPIARSARRSKPTGKSSTTLQLASSSKIFSKENKCKSLTSACVPTNCTKPKSNEDVSVPKRVPAKKPEPFSPMKKLASKGAATSALHLKVPDMRDVSTSSSTLAIHDSPANTIVKKEGSGTSLQSVYISATDMSVENLSIFGESCATVIVRPPTEHTIPPNISFDMKSADTCKLFVSGRRKTLKVRPKCSNTSGLSMPGSLAIGRAKSMKRGRTSSSKTSLQLKKKKNKKEDESVGAAGRTKPRLL